MGRDGGLLRLPRLPASSTPMPSRLATFDGGKKAELSDSSLSSSLEDCSGLRQEHLIKFTLLFLFLAYFWQQDPTLKINQFT